jgi:hypothetical protein
MKCSGEWILKVNISYFLGNLLFCHEKLGSRSGPEDQCVRIQKVKKEKGIRNTGTIIYDPFWDIFFRALELCY